MNGNRPHCSCKKVSGKPYCVIAERWIEIIQMKLHLSFDYYKVRNMYLKYLQEASTQLAKEEYEKELKQIQKDLYRTFPNHKAFRKTTEGTTDITQLKNILRAIVKHNPGIGYVQGMNYIVGSLFHHTCEPVAFWVFDIMVNYYNLRNMFSHNLVGLYIHSQMIDLLIEAKYPEVWEKMVKVLVIIERVFDGYITIMP